MSLEHNGSRSTTSVSPLLLLMGINMEAKARTEEDSPPARSCEVVVLLDRFGSMSRIREDMQCGFDSFVASQQEKPDPCRVTLVQFDSRSVDTVYESIDVNDVPALSLGPRGSTPLLDALGGTIFSSSVRLVGRGRARAAARVIMVVITDGMENASSTFNAAAVCALVEHHEKIHRWEFVYLGADLGGFADARRMGFHHDRVGRFNPGKPGVDAVFSMLDRKVEDVKRFRKPVISAVDRVELDPLAARRA